ncbi:MAG: hypothetical protein HY774_12250, partial [Acidobacteria bacterium]|nr:hypothetical protein [Acidobacteriota bacterium]
AVTTPFTQSNSLGYTILESCMASGVVTAESGGLVGGDIARSDKGQRSEIQPRYVGSPTTNASTLGWQGDQPHTGEVVIDLDLTGVDGEAEIEATLGAAMGAEGQTFASPVTATISGSMSVGSGSVGISVTTTFDENGVVTATDGDFGLGQNVAGKVVTGQVTVEGGGHVTLTYTVSAICSPLVSGVNLSFQGDIGVTCRPVGSRPAGQVATRVRKGLSTPKSSARSLPPQALSPDEEISWTQTWSYDRFGNRKTAVTRIGETENRQDLQVNGRNNRVNETAGMSYDAAGNVIFDNGKTFKYDAENRMVEAVVNGVTTSYRYDGEGLRIKKTVGTAAKSTFTGLRGCWRKSPATK